MFPSNDLLLYRQLRAKLHAKYGAYSVTLLTKFIAPPKVVFPFYIYLYLEIDP